MCELGNLVEEVLVEGILLVGATTADDTIAAHHVRADASVGSAVRRRLQSDPREPGLDRESNEP